MYRCPGTDPRYLRVEVHKCPSCGYEVEIFSNEIKARCPQCRKDVYREKTPSCVDWCQYARQCLGEVKWRQLKGCMDKMQKKGDFKEEILKKMREYFGEDRKRIEHAESVTRYAEKILKKETGDRSVVVAAAILHDIGIKECERKYGHAPGNLQEKEGPPVAGKILRGLGIKAAVIKEVCEIIACHHGPGKIQSVNFNILWDADWLVNLREEYDGKDRKVKEKIINKVFLTPAGKELVRKIYLSV